MADKILIVDDEPDLLTSCVRILRKPHREIFSVSSGEEALRILATEKPEVILTDLRMPGMDGMELMREILLRDPEIQVLFMTAYGTVETAVEALKEGALDFVLKPFAADQLRAAVDRALAKGHTLRQSRTLRDHLTTHHSLDNIIGNSPVMKKVLDVVRKVAVTDASILITGESGTGKELIAHAIYLYSLQSDKPFVPIDCASLPEQLLESELFGYEKGAFTGAVHTKNGLLETADGGTVFLDEVAELPLSLQAKLLRVLQERRLRHIGSTKEQPVNIRVVAATNRNLAELVRTKQFREDLYYRLNVIRIELPPLRERSGDVTLLAQRFVREIGQRKAITGLAPEVEQALEVYDWPGNIRELRNTIERAVALAEESVIRLADLPPEITGRPSGTAGRWLMENSFDGLGFSEAKEQVIEEFERAYLTWLLKRSGNVMIKAAETAGIDRKTLYRLLQKHHIRLLE